MRVLVIIFFLLSTSLLAQSDDLISPVLPLSQPPVTDQTFEWRSAFNESMRFLFLQHGFRMAFQPQTRKRLGGPFLRDYGASVNSIGGWGDSDPWWINYFAHPWQGSASGYIMIQNDPKARKLEFGSTKEYWQSRLKALVWNTAYSTQFEVGPISESSLGNVGQRKGTSGYVDFVMTPAGGFAMMIAEDWLDKRFIQRWEEGTSSVAKRTFYRIALNPGRALANVLRGKGPWHREGRSLVPPPAVPASTGGGL
jgi:hypothetical protein